MWSRKPGWKSTVIVVPLFFTTFSGHRPAQGGWARMGRRSHARCHPYPLIPQPGKVSHTTGVYIPYSFQTVLWVLLHLKWIDQWKCCETGASYGFLSLLEKTRKCNHLQISLQRQHFLPFLFLLLGGPVLSQLS